MCPPLQESKCVINLNSDLIAGIYKEVQSLGTRDLDCGQLSGNSCMYKRIRIIFAVSAIRVCVLVKLFLSSVRMSACQIYARILLQCV